LIGVDEKTRSIRRALWDSFAGDLESNSAALDLSEGLFFA